MEVYKTLFSRIKCKGTNYTHLIFRHHNTFVSKPVPSDIFLQNSGFLYIHEIFICTILLSLRSCGFWVEKNQI